MAVLQLILYIRLREAYFFYRGECRRVNIYSTQRWWAGNKMTRRGPVVSCSGVAT